MRIVEHMNTRYLHCTEHLLNVIMHYMHYCVDIQPSLSRQLGVQSRDEMEWIWAKTLRGMLSLWNNEFMRSEALKRFESLGKIICENKSIEMFAKLLVFLVKETINSCIFQCAVHALDLPIYPQVTQVSYKRYLSDCMQHYIKVYAIPWSINK